MMLTVRSQLDSLVALTLRKFADEETRKDIQTFFEKRDNSGYDRTLRIVDDTVSLKERLMDLDYITDGF